MNRFSRTELLLGPEGMEKLRRAHAAVIGLGAVGSYAVEGLVRAGVGHLRVVDFDLIRESNINRQLYALGSTLGRRKTDVACERVREINPECEVEALDMFIDAAGVNSALRKPVDVVIDAIDSVSPKIELIAAAVRAGIRIISCMGAASRMDPLAVRISDISETEACPLARLIRKKLKKRGVESGVLCVYSVEPASPDAVARAAEDDASGEEDCLQRGRKRRPIGSLSCLPGIFGLTAAQNAVMWIVKRPALKRGGVSAEPSVANIVIPLRGTLSCDASEKQEAAGSPGEGG